MPGKGRLQGGGSGGARLGCGRKKRKVGLTRKEKQLAKQAALAHVESGEEQRAAPAVAAGARVLNTLDKYLKAPTS